MHTMLRFTPRCYTFTSLLMAMVKRAFELYLLCKLLVTLTVQLGGCPCSLDWTTGLTFDGILSILCKLINNSYYGVEHFFGSQASATATNTNNAYMEHCSHANFQVADSIKAFSRQRWLVCHCMLINNSYNNIDRFFSYLMQVQQLQTIPMPIVYGYCHFA